MAVRFRLSREALLLLLLLLLPALQALSAYESCTREAPCVYPGHDCAGNDIFDVGRNRTYTMAECLALCKATKQCEGFVFDQIPSETRQQCRSELSSNETGCCLLKTDCGKGQAKAGDTAVSFLPSLDEWCPRYHQIHSNTLCDPSGPIQTPDGQWHVFNDCYWCTADVAPAFPCPWAHWVSSDLLHWTRVPFNVSGCAAPGCGNPFHSTGSLSYTHDGIVAMNGLLEGNGGLQASTTTDPSLQTWPSAKVVAAHPPSATGGFRDPARAVNINGTWLVAVGSSSHGHAQVLFFADTSEGNLTSFAPPVPLYDTNASFVSGNKVGMFECPDVFLLGGKMVVLTSVEGDTQWLVGRVRAAGDGLSSISFVPETGGYSDQGVDYYAAKTGAPAALTPGSRRLLFAFNGWGGGVTAHTCGRYNIIPRELSLREGFLHIRPIAELAALRRSPSTHTFEGPAPRALVRVGGQLELRVNCTFTSPTHQRGPTSPPGPSGANVSIDVLATRDGAQYARYGYAMATRRFFISTRGLTTTRSKPQTPYTGTPPAWISLVVLVDGGVVESFTDSAASMAGSPAREPWPNGAATTRSFLPAARPFDLSQRGAYISALPAGVACVVGAAELAL